MMWICLHKRERFIVLTTIILRRGFIFPAIMTGGKTNTNFFSPSHYIKSTVVVIAQRTRKVAYRHVQNLYWFFLPASNYAFLIHPRRRRIFRVFCTHDYYYTSLTCWKVNFFIILNVCYLYIVYYATFNQNN